MTSNLQPFEEYLSDYSYVSGYLLSTLDVDLCYSLQKIHIDKNKFPNVNRWFNHVKNFKKNDCLIHGGGNNLSESLSLWISSVLNVRVFEVMCMLISLIGEHYPSTFTKISFTSLFIYFSGKYTK